MKTIALFVGTRLPDGKRFLMLKLPPFDPATAPQIVVRQNWFEELKRPAP